MPGFWARIQGQKSHLESATTPQLCPASSFIDGAEALEAGACLLLFLCFARTGSEPPRASSDQESILPTEKGGQSGGGAGATLHFRVSVPSTLTLSQPSWLNLAEFTG